MEHAKHVGDEENDHDRPQSYSSPAAGTPARMAVVSAADAKSNSKTIISNSIVVLPFFWLLDRAPCDCGISRSAPGAAHLRLQHLFDLADFLLDHARDFLSLALGRQIGVVGEPPRFLFGFALYFMKLALDLILRTWFHISSYYH